jgi:hypothetical protein
MVMRDVPLANGMQIKAGAQIIGHVVQFVPARHGTGIDGVLPLFSIASSPQKQLYPLPPIFGRSPRRYMWTMPEVGT